jgi:hypothetical protein
MLGATGAEELRGGVTAAHYYYEKWQPGVGYSCLHVVTRML